MPTGWTQSAATDRSSFLQTVGAAPHQIVTNTDKVDVSDMLDLLALSDTPFINRAGWGPDSSATSIRWISENLGPGYVRSVSVIESYAAELSLDITTADGLSATNAGYQLHEGSVMYAYNSVDASHSLMVVTSDDTTGSTSFLISNLAGTSVTHVTSIEAGERLFILGQHVNEGSKPKSTFPRDRVVNSNNFAILREDVAISGSMKQTDMYAVGREDRHQIMMRMKELQRNREKTVLYSDYVARSSTHAGMIYGVLGFLLRQGGSNIDSSTKVFTESAFNDVCGAVWDNGGERLTCYGDYSQIGKFTQWDKNRIRTRVNDGKGGGHITSYLTEVGIEVDLVPMRKVPRNIMFVIDDSKCSLRAKKGRKFILEKLGKMGDMDDYQLLSEFSLQMKGFDLGQHGMFTALTPSA